MLDCVISPYSLLACFCVGIQCGWVLLGCPMFTEKAWLTVLNYWTLLGLSAVTPMIRKQNSALCCPCMGWVSQNSDDPKQCVT